MSRPLRVEWPGGLYHVTSRGDGREPIVEDDVDRFACVRLLGASCERFNWHVHVWCLMDSHYHLVLETPEPNLSLGMRHLNGMWSPAIQPPPWPGGMCSRGASRPSW